MYKTYKETLQHLFKGPFGEQDDQQLFVQKVVPETDCLFIRLSSSGKRSVLIKKKR